MRSQRRRSGCPAARASSTTWASPSNTSVARKPAERACGERYALAPSDPAILQALTILAAQTQDWAAALRYAEQWVAVDPQNPSAQGLLQRLRLQNAQ